MPIVTIQKTFDFDAAHRLGALPPDHKCHNLHGHTYRVRLTLEGEPDAVTDMVIDYADIAAVWAPLHAQLDHALLVNKADSLADAVRSVIPTQKVVELDGESTTENLALWIRAQLAASGLHCGVRVYESSTTWAEA